MGVVGTQPESVVTDKVDRKSAHIFLYSAFITDWEYMNLISPQLDVFQKNKQCMSFWI